MEKKKKELLINMVEAGESLIYSDTATIASDAWSGLTKAFDALLKLSAAFISEPKALEVVETITKTRKACTAHMEKYGAVNFTTESQEDHMELYEPLGKLKSKIESAEPLKVEVGTYKITYSISGCGGVNIELLEGEEVADILEDYLLDSGMNLDEREVTITGIKKA